MPDRHSSATTRRSRASHSPRVRRPHLVAHQRLCVHLLPAPRPPTAQSGTSYRVHQPSPFRYAAVRHRRRSRLLRAALVPLTHLRPSPPLPLASPESRLEGADGDALSLVGRDSASRSFAACGKPWGRCDCDASLRSRRAALAPVLFTSDVKMLSSRCMRSDQSLATYASIQTRALAVNRNACSRCANLRPRRHSWHSCFQPQGA